MTITAKELKTFLANLRDEDEIYITGGGSYDCGHGYADAEEILIEDDYGHEIELKLC